jgi:hypothetical protein
MSLPWRLALLNVLLIKKVGPLADARFARPSGTCLSIGWTFVCSE